MSRVFLKISDAEFLRRTPHEISLLMRQALRLLELEQLQVGLLRWTYTNAHREKDTAPLPVEQFTQLFGDAGGAGGDGKKRKVLSNGKMEQTPEEMLTRLKMITVMGGGTIAPHIQAPSLAEAAQYLKQN